MKKRHAVFGLLFGFSVIAAVFFTSFEAAMYADFGVYEREYEKYDVLSELDMTMEDAMYVTHEMMDYLRGDRDTLSVVTSVEGKDQDFFNEQDRFHMGEVRELFLGGLNIRMGACLAAVLCIMMLYASGADMKKVIPFCYRICLGVTAAALALFGAACMADFNAVFVEFHHLFFDNDLWLFDPAEDYMIRMLPEGLFLDMVVRIGVLFAGALLALLICSLIPKMTAGKKKLA